jgi:arylsulfatase A-like enzyme
MPDVRAINRHRDCALLASSRDGPLHARGFNPRSPTCSLWRLRCPICGGNTAATDVQVRTVRVGLPSDWQSDRPRRGMVDNIDQNLGRLLATVEGLGELDNTIVVFTSDNGGPAEGGPAGTRSYFSQFAQVVMRQRLPDAWPRDVRRNPDLIGGPQVAVHYPRGWGMASNSPFRLYKGNTFAGGVRVPFLISWPAGLAERGIRSQYQYVTDLHATHIDLAGVARPAERHGQPVKDIDGVSFRSVLADAVRRARISSNTPSRAVTAVSIATAGNC